MLELDLSNPTTVNAEFVSMQNVDDLFVKIVVQQLSLIKDERVMIRFLRGCEMFRLLSLSKSMSLLLQSDLYLRTKRGGPYYMPVEARGVARSTLDVVFPAGKYSRAIVSFAFGLLQPIYSVQSFWRRLVSVYGVIMLWIITCCHCRKLHKKGE